MHMNNISVHAVISYGKVQDHQVSLWVESKHEACVGGCNLVRMVNIQLIYTVFHDIDRCISCQSVGF